LSWLLDSAELMDARYPGKAIPLVGAALAPPRDPVVGVLSVLVGAGLHAAPGEASLIAPVEITSVHVTFLSSH